MLTVNFLAPARRRRRLAGPHLIAGLTLSLVLVVFAVWSYVLIAQVNQLRRDLVQATHEAARLRPIAEQVQGLRQSAAGLRTHRDLLQQLLTRQMPASQIIETTRAVVPHDVWLTSVTAGTSDVAFEGYTFSYPSIARFMIELQDSGSVRRVDLSTSQRETLLDREVVKFRITGDLVVARPVASRKEGAP